VDPATLQQIDRAERGVKALGFTTLRVRHHDDLGKLELPEEDLPRALAHRAAIATAIKEAGYTRAAIDLEPFRSGALNVAFHRRG
jgi:uncharacterized protein